MPHLIIKHFPRHFSADQKRHLAAQLTLTLTACFDAGDEAISISLIPIDESQWMSLVYEQDIMGKKSFLIKHPGYRPIEGQERGEA